MGGPCPLGPPPIYAYDLGSPLFSLIKNHNVWKPQFNDGQHFNAAGGQVPNGFGMVQENDAANRLVQNLHSIIFIHGVYLNFIVNKNVSIIYLSIIAIKA